MWASSESLLGNVKGFGEPGGHTGGWSLGLEKFDRTKGRRSNPAPSRYGQLQTSKGFGGKDPWCRMSLIKRKNRLHLPNESNCPRVVRFQRGGVKRRQNKPEEIAKRAIKKSLGG